MNAGENVDAPGEDLPETLTKLLKPFRSWVDLEMAASEARGKIEGPLHHYSDMNALVGMVQSQTLWLTNIFHLNDPSELVFGMQLSIDELERHIGLVHFFPGEWNFVNEYKSEFCVGLISKLANHIGEVFGVYVASFSRCGNDLSQWRAYADDGRGVALEVSDTWFTPVAPKDDAPPLDRYFVSTVEYDEEKCRERQREAIDRVVAIAIEAGKLGLLFDAHVRAAFFRELQVAVAVPLLWNSLTVKHKAYKGEQETRLILINHVDVLAPLVKTRTRGSEIVSYLPIDFPLKRADVLRKVMVGPSALGAANTGVKNLLLAQGLKSVEVLDSSIPYRSR